MNETPTILTIIIKNLQLSEKFIEFHEIKRVRIRPLLMTNCWYQFTYREGMSSLVSQSTIYIKITIKTCSEIITQIQMIERELNAVNFVQDGTREIYAK